jgi:hypothetical protein
VHRLSDSAKAARFSWHGRLLEERFETLKAERLSPVPRHIDIGQVLGDDLLIQLGGRNSGGRAI